MWRSVRGAQPPGRIFTGFAASLLPIAVAYHLAHYASYLALAGQCGKLRSAGVAFTAERPNGKCRIRLEGGYRGAADGNGFAVPPP